MLCKAVLSYPEKCSFLLKHGATVTKEMIKNAESQDLTEMLQKYHQK